MDFGEIFGILSNADINSIEIITRNNDVAIGDIFAISSKRGSEKYFLFKCINYTNKMRRQASLEDPATSLIINEESYVANLEDEKVLKVEGILLGYVMEDIETEKFIFKKPRRVPEHFSKVYRLTSGSRDLYAYLEKMLRSELEGDLKIGFWLTGEESIPLEIKIPKDKLSMHVGIWGATGSGKSNLMQNLTKSFIDFNINAVLNERMKLSLFTIDPHDEYALGTGSHGIADIIDLINAKNEKIRKKICGDFYYLTPIKSAAPANVRRYAKEIRIGMNEISPVDIFSIIELSPAQAIYLDRLVNDNPEDWIEQIGTEMEGTPKSTVQATKRYLRWLQNSSMITTKDRSILIDIIAALERGQVLIFNSSLMDQFEQFLCVTVIARTLFEIRKAVKSSTDLNVLKKQLKQRRLDEHFIKKLESYLPEFYGKPGNKIKSMDELCPILLTIEEAPSLLTPEIMRQSGNIYKSISRQGRKFGLGLCVISQQVSSIHPALLSQINTQISLALGNSSEIDLAIKSSSRDISEFKSEFKVLNRGEGIITTSYKNLPFVFKAPLFDNEFRETQDFYNRLEHELIPGEIEDLRETEFD
ncbi:MAG: ATP-binding protein [Candidatus Helarchaeota archaeon]